MLRLLFPLWLLVFSFVYMAFESSGFIERSALASLTLALATALFWVSACIGVGGAVFQKLRPEEKAPWDMAFGLGLGIWGGLAFIVASLSIMGPISSALIAALMSFAWFLKPQITLPAPPKTTWLLLGLLLCIALIDAWAPPIDTDAVYYHIALPKQIWLQGETFGGPLHPNGSRPLLLHLPFAVLFGWAGDSGPPVFHAILSLMLVMSIIQRGEALAKGAGLWAIALLLSSWSFVSEFGLASNNLPTAFMVWLTAHAVMKYGTRIPGVLAGFALSFKYTAIGPISGIWLVLMDRKSKLKGLCIAVAVLAIWPIRNAIGGLHPLFPFAGWEIDFPFQYLEKYGNGRDVQSMILLPWNMIMHATTDDFSFLGRLNPLWLGALPIALMCSWKDRRIRQWGKLSAIAFVAWASGPHWIRHLMPAAPLIALFLGLSLASLSRAGACAALSCCLVGLPANWGPIVQKQAKRLPAAFGKENPAVHQGENIPGWTSAKWASERLPKDARVALFYTWPGLAMDRPYVLGSVEDHVPSRHWILKHGHDVLSELEKQGVDHVIVGPSKIPRHIYSFISDTEYSSRFLTPAETLEAALLRDAELIYEHRRHGVYRLRKKN